MNPLRWLVGSRPRTPGAEMSFFDHLEELRSVLLGSLAAVFIFGLAGWPFSARVMDSLVHHAGLASAQAIRPQEIFLTRFKISAAIGVLVGLPYIALRVWGFIVPGLLQRERRVIFPLVFWSTALFLAGTAFAVFMLAPIMLGFLAGFATDVVSVNPAVSQVLDFYLFTALACGLVFQLPLAIAILSYFGIISPRFLTRYWRHAMVIILIVAAVLTPADVISQLAMGVPIIVLYFASIAVSFAACRARRSGSPEEQAPGPGGGDAAPQVEAPGPGGGDAAPQVETPGAGGGDAAPQVETPGTGGGDAAPEAEARAASPAARPDRAAPEVRPEEGAREAPPAPEREQSPGDRRPLHPPDQDWSI